MENSFDFGTLLKNNEKKHKIKPTQFVSVAGGVQKRLQTNIKNRKSTRLTAFDNARNLEKCNSPVLPLLSEAQLKMERRRQQLEKWKADKEQKKKAQAALKKKPFLAGVPRNPLSFVPPPPLPKPSTSGRVTRSQTRSTLSKQKTKSPVKPTAKGRNTLLSFAPTNAAFKPAIKNLAKLPKLAPVSRSKNKTTVMISFDPVVPTAPSTAKQTSIRPTLTRQNAIELRYNTRPKLSETRSTTRGKSLVKKPFTSSTSGSDIEPSKIRSRIKTPGPRKPLKEPKQLNPKLLTMKSTSSEESSEDSGGTTSRRKSARKSVSCIKDSQSCSDSVTSDANPSSVKEQTIRINRNRKSVSNNYSLKIPSSLTSGSSTEISSEAEIVKEKSPIVLLRRSSLGTPKNKGVPKSESSSEEKLRSPKPLMELPLTPEQAESAKLSPCVTFSRGKDNARKEMKWKLQEGLLDEDSCNINSVDHFRKQLSSEIKRITEMCDTWDKISAQTALPEPVQEAVLSAVGQARLLMSQKLAQFASLVERCAKPEPGTALVTPADLHGFWDMVFIQVVNVDVRFKKLEELRSRNWVEQEPSAPARAGGKRAPSKPVARKAPIHGTSSIRAAIAAARRAKKEQEQCSDSSPAPEPPEKTFEAGFFVVRTPVRSSSSRSPLQPAASATPANRNALLKAVLSSEAKKASTSKQSTPFAMLRASLIGKNMECEGFALLPQTPDMTPVNQFATPGRSILKPTNVASIKSGKKNVKTVLFDDSEESDSQYQSCIRDSAQSTRSRVKINVTKDSVVQDKENSSELKELNSSIGPEFSSVRTRSQRKSLQNLSNMEDSSVVEVRTPRSSRQKKSTKKVADTEKTPQKQSGRKKSEDADQVVEGKRSTRKKALKNLEAIPTPKRSSRRNKAQDC